MLLCYFYLVVYLKMFFMIKLDLMFELIICMDFFNEFELII